MSNDGKFYCPDLDRWFDSLYEMQQAVFGDMKWPSAEEEREMIHRANLSAALKGKPGNNKGKPRSAEARAKSSATQKGKPKSAEHKAKNSAAQKGKILTEEHKASVSAALKGKTHSEESKIKMAAVRKAYWAQRRAEKAAAQICEANEYE